MTAVLIPRDAPTVGDRIPPVLLDTITETLLSAADRHERADIIAVLMAEVYLSVEWASRGGDGCEVLSLRHLLEEARAHQARVDGLAAQLYLPLERALA